METMISEIPDSELWTDLRHAKADLDAAVTALFFHSSMFVTPGGVDVVSRVTGNCAQIAAIATELKRRSK